MYKSLKIGCKLCGYLQLTLAVYIIDFGKVIHIGQQYSGLHNYMIQI